MFDEPTPKTQIKNSPESSSKRLLSLDAKDLKILAELDSNPRIPTSHLAKRIRTSQQVVDYRLKNLEKSKLLSFATIINESLLGLEQYRVFFQLSKISQDEKQKLIDHLKDNFNVYWAALVGGAWDLFVVVFVKDYSDFESFLDSLFKRFPKEIKDYDSLYVLEHSFYQHSFLDENNNSVIRMDHSVSHNSQPTPPSPHPLSQKPDNKRLQKTNIHASYLSNPLLQNPIYEDYAKNSRSNLVSKSRRSSIQESPQITIDSLDLRILDAIKSNCRLSSLELANRFGVSYKTIQNRIKLMEKNKAIAGYRLFLKSEGLGFNAYLVLISFKSYGKLTEKCLLSFAHSHPSITQSIKLFGKWSLMLHVRAKDLQELQDLIINLRDSYSIIGNYEIIPIFRDISINTLPQSGEMIL